MTDGITGANQSRHDTTRLDSNRLDEEENAPVINFNSRRSLADCCCCEYYFNGSPLLNGNLLFCSFFKYNNQLRNLQCTPC